MCTCSQQCMFCESSQACSTTNTTDTQTPCILVLSSYTSTHVTDYNAHAGFRMSSRMLDMHYRQRPFRRAGCSCMAATSLLHRTRLLPHEQVHAERVLQAAIAQARQVLLVRQSHTMRAFSHEQLPLIPPNPTAQDPEVLGMRYRQRSFRRARYSWMAAPSSRTMHAYFA